MSINTNAEPVAVSLPDPDEFPDRDVVVYDGLCNACEMAAKRLHQIDFGRGRLAFLSLHDARVTQRYANLSHDDLMAQMYVIDTDGNQHGGSDAIRYLSRRMPLMWILAPLMHIPGTAGLWRRMYRMIARNRYWVSKKFFGTPDACESGSCSIHHR